MPDDSKQPVPNSQPSPQQNSLASSNKVIQPVSNDLASPVPTPSSVSSASPAPEPAPLSPASANVYSVAPAPPPANPTNNAVNSGMLVGSQLAPEKKSYGGLIIKGAIALAIVVVLFVGLIFAKSLLFSKFKSVTYDNGKGNTFNLKFYSRYSVKNVSQSTAATSSASISSDLQELASKVSVNNKTPLILWIEANTGNSASFINNDCTKNGLTKAFDARVDYINSNVSVCVVKAQAIDLIYLATFHDNKNGYLVYIAQDFNFQDTLSSPQNAKDTLAKAGLVDYQDDIKTILASIKPAN